MEPKDKSQEIQPLSLVEKTITKINFCYGLYRQGKTINVSAYVSKDFFPNFNFLAQNSAKNVDYELRREVGFDNMSHKAASLKNPYIIIRQNP